MNEDREIEDDPFIEPWIRSWEQQCIQEMENEPDVEERVRSEKDLAAQKCWQLFQNSATAIAQLYKDRQQGLALWTSFQMAAGAVTCLYKESLDIQRRSFELGLLSGNQRRTKDMLSWAKKHRRHIRREELIAYLANRSPPSRSRNPRQRLVLERNNPRINIINTEPTHVHNPEADMQTFREALTLASLNGAMSNVNMSYRGHSSNSPPIGSHSRRRTTASSPNGFSDFGALCEEYTAHCEARKRTAASTDVIMDSPTHKRSRLS